MDDLHSTILTLFHRSIFIKNLMAGAEVGRKIVEDLLKLLCVLQNNQTLVLVDGFNTINPIFSSGAYTNKPLYDLISSTVTNQSSTLVKGKILIVSKLKLY